MTLEAIKWCKGKLEILDQLLLPLESKYISVENTEKGWEVIHKMQVRGAPGIAIVGCLSLAAELASTDLEKYQNKEELYHDIVKKVDFLQTARPTAVNMKISGQELVNYSKSLLEHNDISVVEYSQKIINWCILMLENDVSTNKLISEHGCESLLKTVGTHAQLVVLTHCNTGSLATAGYGTALGVIRKLHSCKRLGRVYCTETRPYNQGARLTAYELVFEKMPAILICDDMVGALMRTKKCDAVIVGADRITRNGDTANKIGTYQVAVLAKHHGIPFYVCAPSTSIDLSLEDGNRIPIEERPHEEMTCVAGNRIAAPGIGCWNPAFDVTPAELISGGIVTEKGVFPPHLLYDKLTENMN